MTDKADKTEERPKKPKKTIWVLGVDHGEFDHVVAIFSSARKGLKYLKSLGFKDMTKYDDEEYRTTFTVEEARVKGLFDSYYTKWNTETYVLILKERTLNKQFIFDYDE